MSPQDPEEHAAGPQQGDHERAGHHHRGGHHRHPQARQSGLQAGRSLPDQFGTGINRFLDWEGWFGGGFRGADGARTLQEMCKAATEALSPPSAPAELRRNASSGECGLNNPQNPRFLQKKSFGGALIHCGPPGSASSRLPHDRQQPEPGLAARHPHPPARHLQNLRHRLQQAGGEERG